MMKIYAIEVWEGTWQVEKHVYLITEFYTSLHDATNEAWEVLDYLKARAKGNEYIDFVKDPFSDEVEENMRRAGNYKICHIVEHSVIK